MNDDLQSADVGTAETASPGPEPGHFDGPVAASGGEAVDMREAQGPIYKPSGPVTQHFQTIVRKVAPVLGFVALAAGIVVGLLLAAGVINLQGIVETVRDLQPTPVAFAPAAEGESLIIVADFEDRSEGRYQGVDPAQYIYERLKEQAQADGLSVRIERLREATDDSTARSTGEVYGAALVLWGWYDGVGVTPRLEHIGIIEMMPGCPTCQESALQLAEPETVEFKQSILETLPERTMYLVSFALGLDAYSHSDLETALVYFNNALDIAEQGAASVTADETYFYRGSIYHSHKQYNLAIADYTYALALNPDFIYAYNNRGLTYNAMGKYEQALADYDRALELNPEYAGVYYNRGLIYYDMGEYEQALANYDRAIELNPEYAEVYNSRGRIYCYNMGEYEQALADYDRAIELNPEYAGAYHNRGLIYYDMGEYERALADYDRAIVLNSEFTEAYSNRGLTYYDMGEHEQALADYDRAIVLNPEFAEAYYNRGLIYSYNMGKYEQALADFDRALELNSESAEAYNNRGNSYGAMGEYEQALADFDRAIELNPEYADLYISRGLTYNDMGEYEQALADYNRAIELNPELDTPYANRGLLYAQLGQVDKAIADFERFIELTQNPQWREWAEQILRELKGDQP